MLMEDGLARLLDEFDTSRGCDRRGSHTSREQNMGKAHLRSASNGMPAITTCDRARTTPSLSPTLKEARQPLQTPLRSGGHFC